MAGAPAADTTASVQPEPAARNWEFYASAYMYLVPDDRDYLQPTGTADRGWLHLEARYNYEDLETGSVWLGYNFSFGGELSLDIVPMVAGILGNTNGIAAGYHVSLAWRWLELYSEGEFVRDIDERADSFFYAWSELVISPVEWLHGGLVGQRTRVYETDLEVQRGFLVGGTFETADVTGYMFNPDESRPTYMLAVGVSF